MFATAAFMLLGAQTGSFEPGLSLRIYDLQTPITELAPLVPGQTPNIDRRVERLEFRNGSMEIKNHFLAEISGEFLAKEDAQYTFKLSSDDGSVVSIDDHSVVENDSIHAPKSVEGRVYLKKGWHKILLRFFQEGGGYELKLEWKGGGQSEYSVADGSVLRCTANLTRVVSPGQKFVMVTGGKRRPGNGMPLSAANPAYKIIPIRPAGFEPQVGALATLPDGSLLVTTFQPNQSGQFLPDLKDGKVWRLTGVETNDASKVKAKVIAENLQEPLGMCVVQDNGKSHIYLSTRTEICELVDQDATGFYRNTKTVAKAWVANNYHHFTFGLAEKDGFLYAAMSTSIAFNAPGLNGPNPANRGSSMKIDPRRYDPSKPMSNVEYITGGHRTPNGVSVGPNGLLITGENQGAWQPSNKINLLQPGVFLGHYNNRELKTKEYPEGGVPGLFDEQPLEPPVVHLPQNEISNSPGQSIVLDRGPFAGHLLITDVKNGGLRRGWFEKVDGIWQGGAVSFSQGFEVGTTRIVPAEPGNFYVGGLGATETWAWTDPKTGKWSTQGLQKMIATGKTAFEIHSMNVTPKGFRINFTEPVGELKPDNFVVKQWAYKPTPEYGGDKINRETLSVQSIKMSPDRRSAELVIPGRKPDRVVYFNVDAKNDRGQELWATECWYTLNRLPYETGGTALLKPNPRLLVFSKTAAFRHDSIPTGRTEIEKLAKANGFTAQFTEDSSVFTADSLKNFDVVVFLCTTGDILNPEQKAAFEKYIHAGGGYVGIHSATDTEYKWPFYTGLVGAQFRAHPPGTYQAKVVVEDRTHPSTTFLPNSWIHVDEWYNFRANPRKNVQVLASLDESSYKGGDMGDHPVIWCHEYEGGRAWYTALGHTQSTYHEELFRKSLVEGILWAAQGGVMPGATRPSWKSLEDWTSSLDQITNNPARGRDIVTTDEYDDVWLHAEFKVPKNGNSGVYFMGRYEVQIFDSFGKAWKDLEHSDCGGIYQRWDDSRGPGNEGYEGTPPRRNVFRGPNTWNSYDVLFRAPRFVNGKKVENARFIEVRLNGNVVQRNVEVTGPTRVGFGGPEVSKGPLRLQGDHGPVSFRNIRIKRVKL